MNKDKKLIMNIKGSCQKLWVNLFLNKKAKSLGVRVDKIEHPSKGHSRIVVVGEETKLWKVINWSKKPGFFVRLDHIIFEFRD